MVKAMWNSTFLTGNPKVDFVLLGIAWVFAGINPQSIPIILSSIASVLVIVNQIVTLRKKKRKS
jgi:hypothetical protein